MKKKKTSRKKILHHLHHIPSLQETIARLRREHRITAYRDRYIHAHLEEWVNESKYILMNFAVHIGLGFFRFTALPFPLPIGSTLRGLWVMGNRMHCNLIWDMRRKSVHSIPVLLFSLIPFLGYFAYTIPLKKKSEYLAYLYAQHVAYHLYDAAFEEKLERLPRFLRSLGLMLLVPRELREGKPRE